ncbi:MAG: UmuC protein [Patescibacteria group bacterium]|nr:UmuC protein [Patescibacteria group bacterium]
MPNCWPRAIVHIDGDCFFVACEVAKNPKLKGQPVVVGADRGIACAMSYEAKALGVTRGMPVGWIRKICPNTIILPEDPTSYTLYSRRMYEIVRRYTPEVEEYSIDECFADITGMHRVLHKPYIEIAREIQQTLKSELGLDFSVGLSVNKVLAKIASKKQKPNGFTVIDWPNISDHLQTTTIQSLWGIGSQTARQMFKLGIKTAYDLASKPPAEIFKSFTKPHQEIWHELQGKFIFLLNTKSQPNKSSISKTKTFGATSSDQHFVYSALSANIEGACSKLRKSKLLTGKVSIFLKTQQFEYSHLDFVLPWPTTNPKDILDICHQRFAEVFSKEKKYRATGVTLSDLKPINTETLNLFGEAIRKENNKIIYRHVDLLDHRFGANTIFLASSLSAIKYQKMKDKTSSLKNFLSNKKRHLGLLSLGRVN